MTPAGTSNELDVQNEWEENTHTLREYDVFGLCLNPYNMKPKQSCTWAHVQYQLKSGHCSKARQRGRIISLCWVLDLGTIHDYHILCLNYSLFVHVLLLELRHYGTCRSCRSEYYGVPGKSYQYLTRASLIVRCR